MADLDSESLLLEDTPDKYSEDSDGDICNADEDALLADCDETDYIYSKTSSRLGSKFVDEDLSVSEEQESEDVLDLGTLDVELDDDEGHRKKRSNAMTVSSTTPAEAELNLSQEEVEERQTRFKTERKITTNKKYSNIPDSLDEVVLSNSYQNNRNQKPFRGRNKGYQQNNFQRKNPANRTVLINPHFKGRPNVQNTPVNWDARQRLNQNYKNQLGPGIQPLMHRNIPISDMNWNNMHNVQQQQPPPQAPIQFQQFIPPPHIPQQQLYHHQRPLPAPQVSNWNQFQENTFQQIPQQLLPTYQPPQQCFIQPLQESFYSQPPPLLNYPSQYNQPAPQFQPPVSQFPPDAIQYPPQNPIGMMPYANTQYAVPQNQILQPLEPYVQPVYNQPIQNINPPPNQLLPNQQPKPNKFNQSPNVNKRKVLNNGIVRKNKKRIHTSPNLHTVQIPDTTVQEDDEDEETKQYRKLIDEQKRKREQILEQKEARRRQVLQAEQNNTTLKQIQQLPVPVEQPKFVPIRQNSPLVIPKPVLATNRIVPKIQQVLPLNTVHRVLNNTARKVIPTNMTAVNPNIKVIKVSNVPNHNKQHLSSFLTNRKILAKDESLLDTNIVLISNLAHGTTAVKLRKMCVGIGDVKNLQMSPKERQATIQFTSVASAHAYFKKYQHTMLDLSMIQVTLQPMN